MSEPILFYSPIFNETVENYTRQLLNADGDTETWINSPGGSVFAGWAAIGALKQRKGENKAVVMGDASSMAFYMLMFYDSVEAIDTASFTVHRADTWVDTEDDKKLLININKEISAKFGKRVDKEKFQEITGVSFDEVFSMEQRKDVHLTAKQAKQIGIIDKIIKLEPRQIAALNSLNLNINKMENPFKKKTPQKSVKVGESQILYRDLEAGREIEILGSSEIFTGNFEADGKKVDVVENKITAIAEISIESKEITALKSEITALKGENSKLEKDVTEILASAKNEIEALKAEVTAMKETLAKAKLNVSSPNLPQGEFKGDEAKGDSFEMTLSEKIAAEQAKMYEAKRKSKEG